MDYVLGISAYYHDSAAALLRNGEIIAAAQEERFSRKKGDPGFPHRAVEFCLARARPGPTSSACGSARKRRRARRVTATGLRFAPKGTEWSLWDGRTLYRSGVWTTPHFPGNPSYPTGGDDLEMRSIMTMSNRYVVATLYSVDYVNVVIVVRQTNWVGPAVPSDADPVAGMDTYYRGWRLDWVENSHDSVPADCNN